MAERWVNGARHDPGVNAGGSITSMQFCVMHFTAGRDSRQIGKNGYFTALYPKEGSMIQYCGLDEYCWHAGPWNAYGPGLEFERMNADEPLTPDQEFWGGITAVILNRDYGIPLEHYQGPRFQAGNFQGFVNHGDLDNQRSDGVTQDEFNRMFDHNEPAAVDEGEPFMIWETDEPTPKYFILGTGGMLEIDGGMAYIMAISGGHIVHKVHPLAVLKMGLDNARMMQRALALKF